MSVHPAAPTQITLTTPRGEGGAAPATSDQPSTKNDFWGEDGFAFGDLLDVINPLQHIPIVSTIYRAITHDDIAPGPRMAGDTLLGGLLGFIGGLANVVVEQATGKDIGENIVAAFNGDDKDNANFAAARDENEAAALAIDRNAAAQLQEDVEREYAALNDQVEQTGVLTEQKTLYPSNPMYHKQYRMVQGLG